MDSGGISDPLLKIFNASLTNGICEFYTFGGYHHHQPINVPTSGAQAFLMEYTYGKLTITHHAGSAGWWALTTANVVGTNGLTRLPKHGGA
jgi:hypothetical protein